MLVATVRYLDNIVKLKALNVVCRFERSALHPFVEPLCKIVQSCAGTKL